MDKSYWTSVLDGRLSRRRMLASTTAGIAAAGVLSACGGSDSGSEQGQGLSLLTKPVDRTKEAVPGGTYQDFDPQDIQGMDPHRLGSFRAMAVASYTTVRLIKKKTSFDGVFRNEAVPDLAESWEFSPDGLQLTFKLRQGVIWERRAPTNGRAVDAQDVKFSADRFLATSGYANNFFNSKSPAAPILDIQTPDARTVVMKLAYPYVPLLATLSRSLTIWMLPREADGGYDPRGEVRSSGPWLLEEYKPSASLLYKRNPDYYEKSRPFFDKWSIPLVSEYATQLAQFRAGNIWHGVAVQEDVLPLKRDFPQLNMFQGDYATGTPIIYFGFNGPLKDVRLRQAMSYIIDRQLIADTFSDSTKFEEAGLPRALRLNTHIGAGWPEWVDPLSKDFGENAKYYKMDLAEAKKLAAAAGVKTPLDIKFFFPPATYGTVYQRYVPVVAGMLNDSGIFNAQLTPAEYNNVWLPEIFYGGGRVGSWNGAALIPAGQGDDAGHQLQIQYHSSGAVTRQPPGEDPRLDQMIEAQLRETDPKRRAQLIQDTQRYMPTTMIAVPFFYQGAGFGVSWPWVGNLGAVRSGTAVGSEVYPYYWFDKDAYAKLKP